jgi:hypothetical protein
MCGYPTDRSWEPRRRDVGTPRNLYFGFWFFGFGREAARCRRFGYRASEEGQVVSRVHPPAAHAATVASTAAADTSASVEGAFALLGFVGQSF